MVYKNQNYMTNPLLKEQADNAQATKETEDKQDQIISPENKSDEQNQDVNSEDQPIPTQSEPQE